MDMIRALEIAKGHEEETRIHFTNGESVFIQTVEEKGCGYDYTPFVVYISLDDSNEAPIETHTTGADDISGIAYWIFEMCYNLEEC